jgi:hypothetical protein
MLSKTPRYIGIQKEVATMGEFDLVVLPGYWVVGTGSLPGKNL